MGTSISDSELLDALDRQPAPTLDDIAAVRAALAEACPGGVSRELIAARRADCWCIALVGCRAADLEAQVSVHEVQQEQCSFNSCSNLDVSISDVKSTFLRRTISCFIGRPRMRFTRGELVLSQ